MPNLRSMSNTRFAAIAAVLAFTAPGSTWGQTVDLLGSDPTQGLQISDPANMGYVAEEYLLRGNADVLEPVTMVDAQDTMGIDNTALMARKDDYATKVLSADQPYVGRVIVYRPADPDRFSGSVVVETMHPSGGGTPIVWNEINPFFTRRGHAYVIVQHPATFAGLQHGNAERYAELSAEASSQLWGMLADTGRLLKGDGIGGLKARHLYMTGYSFTGVSTATFADYHHDDTRLADGSPVYDAYFPMAAGMYVRDLDVPAFTMMTNSDFNIFGSVQNRKPDSDAPGSQYRLYEIAGPSHATSRTAQPGEAVRPEPFELPEAEGMPSFNPGACFAGFPKGYAPNDYPLRMIEAALFRNLIAWVEDGTVPPPGARIEIGADEQPLLDEHGNARGGIRLPPVTVPTKSYGMGKEEACFIFGYAMPFAPEKMKSLYGSRDAYVAKVKEAADAMVEQRLLLPEGAIELVNRAKATPEF